MPIQALFLSMNNPAVRMKDVAEALGIHQTTVSLALRNSPKLPEQTKLRIQAKAEEMGYQVNPQIAALMATRRTGKYLNQPPLAFITSYASRDGWKRSKNYARLFEAAKSRAEQLGYNLEVIWAREPGMTPERLSDILTARGIRGLVIAPLPGREHRLELDWARFSALTCGYTLQDPDLHRVTINQFTSMTLLCEKLTSMNFKRIGFLTRQQQNERVMYRWLGGFLAYQYSQPKKPHIDPFLPEVFKTEQLLSWMERHQPEAIISNGSDALVLRNIISKNTFKCDKPVVANLDCLQDDGSEIGIYQEIEDEGAAAIEHVSALVQRNETGLPKFPRTWTTAIRFVGEHTQSTSMALADGKFSP